jgi:hypothetical protein
VPGRFITFEGIDGAGKSSHIDATVAWLRERGHDVVVTREPGGTPLAETLRDLVLHRHGPVDRGPAGLCGAARPPGALHRAGAGRGRTVVCDRFTDASFAYQGAGAASTPGAGAALEQWVQQGRQPDLTCGSTCRRRWPPSGAPPCARPTASKARTWPSSSACAAAMPLVRVGPGRFRRWMRWAPRHRLGPGAGGTDRHGLVVKVPSPATALAGTRGRPGAGHGHGPCAAAARRRGRRPVRVRAGHRPGLAVRAPDGRHAAPCGHCSACRQFAGGHAPRSAPPAAEALRQHWVLQGADVAMVTPRVAPSPSASPAGRSASTTCAGPSTGSSPPRPAVAPRSC